MRSMLKATLCAPYTRDLPSRAIAGALSSPRPEVNGSDGPAAVPSTVIGTRDSVEFLPGSRSE